MIHSVSRRNAVVIHLAQAAAARGARIVAITNRAFSECVTSRHPSGLKLYQLADIVLDKHGQIGKACVTIPGLDQKAASTSTVSEVVLMHAIVAGLVSRLVASGISGPPVFCSANLGGGDRRSQELLEKYRDRIHIPL